MYSDVQNWRSLAEKTEYIKIRTQLFPPKPDKKKPKLCIPEGIKHPLSYQTTLSSLWDGEDRSPLQIKKCLGTVPILPTVCCTHTWGLRC
jgi:hypothetical protein